MSDQENRQDIHANADRIPADVRDKVLTAIENAEETDNDCARLRKFRKTFLAD